MGGCVVVCSLCGLVAILRGALVVYCFARFLIVVFSGTFLALWSLFALLCFALVCGLCTVSHRFLLFLLVSLVGYVM